MENRRPAELELSRRVIGAAIEVHRELGPGLLESAYRSCMAQELLEMGLGVEVEVPVALQSAAGRSRRATGWISWSRGNSWWS